MEEKGTRIKLLFVYCYFQVLEMARELTNHLSEGLQCGSQFRGDFKQSLTIRIIVAVFLPTLTV